MVDEHSKKLLGAVLKEFDVLQENVTRGSLRFFCILTWLTDVVLPTLLRSSVTPLLSTLFPSPSCLAPMVTIRNS